MTGDLMLPGGERRPTTAPSAPQPGAEALGEVRAPSPPKISAPKPAGSARKRAIAAAAIRAWPKTQQAKAKPSKCSRCDAAPLPSSYYCSAHKAEANEAYKARRAKREVAPAEADFVRLGKAQAAARPTDGVRLERLEAAARKALRRLVELSTHADVALELLDALERIKR